MDIEDILRGVLAHEPIHEATPADRDAVDRVAGRLRRRRLIVRWSGVAVLLAAVVVTVAVWPRGDDTVDVETAPWLGASAVTDDWVTVTDPVLGWTMQVPPSWSSRSFAHLCMISFTGTITRSNGDPPPNDEDDRHCTNGFDWRHVPRDSVVVALTHQEDRFASTLGTSPPADTELPLEVDDPLDPTPPPDGTEPPGQFDASYLRLWSTRVVVDGDDNYLVSLWYGVESSVSDRDDARLVVASMRPPESAPPTTDPVVRTVRLPTIPVQQTNLEHLVVGRLVRHGDCLDFDIDGEAHMVVWQGDAEMTVTDAQLLGVTVRGKPLSVDGELTILGGEFPGENIVQLPADIAPLSDLLPECLTTNVFVASP